MTLLWTVVAVLAVATALNLLLTLALVRRLRAGDLGIGSGASASHGVVPEPGLLVGEFAETATTGRLLTADFLGPDALAAFLSPHCGPCRTTSATLLARHGDLPEVTLVFVAGDADDPDDQAFAAELAAIADVAFVDPFGSASDAFGGIRELPTIVRVQDGFVTAASNEVRDVLAPAPVRS